MAKNMKGIVETVIDAAMRQAAQDAKKTLYNTASKVIGKETERAYHKSGDVLSDRINSNTSFYGGYNPKRYNRTGNLARSFKASSRSDNFKGAKSYSASVTFSTDHMPYSTHLTYDGGTPYPKGLVMLTSFDKGLHGYVPSMGYNVDSIGRIKDARGSRRTTKKFKRKKTGETYFKTMPSPLESMVEQLNRMTRDKNLVGRVQDSIVEGVFNAVVSGIDKS